MGISSADRKKSAKPAPPKATGRIRMGESGNGRYWFDLVAGNGAVIATSKTYNDKRSAMRGAEAAAKATGDIVRIVG